MHNMLHHTSLKRQFELRQAAWKPNMHVQDDVPLFRVDPVLTGEYVTHRTLRTTIDRCSALTCQRGSCDDRWCMPTSRIAASIAVWLSCQGSSPTKRGLFGNTGMFTDKG